MQFHFEMLQNVRKYVFRDKQTTNKVPLMFFDFIVLTEREQWTLSTNKQRRSVCI